MAVTLGMGQFILEVVTHVGPPSPGILPLTYSPPRLQTLMVWPSWNVTPGLAQVLDRAMYDWTVGGVILELFCV